MSDGYIQFELFLKTGQIEWIKLAYPVIYIFNSFQFVESDVDEQLIVHIP